MFILLFKHTIRIAFGVQHCNTIVIRFDTAIFRLFPKSKALCRTLKLGITPLIIIRVKCYHPYSTCSNITISPMRAAVRMHS